MALKFFFLFFAVISQAHAADESSKAKGDRAFIAKNFAEAIRLYSEAILAEPNSRAGALMNRGLAHFNLKSFDKARADFKTIRVTNSQNGKAAHWLGKTYVALNDLSRARFYFSQAANQTNTPESNNNYISSVDSQFKQELIRLAELSKLSKAPASLYKNLEKIPGYDLAKFLSPDYYTKKYAPIANLLEKHWKENNCVPLNAIEIPGKIAEFIGTGKHIATVLVQTLPFHLLKNFKSVSIFDTAPPQIDFHNNLKEAIETNKAQSFLEQAKSNLKNFATLGQTASDQNAQLFQRIDFEFRELYKFLKDFQLKADFAVHSGDIFEGVDKDTTIDVVFVSSIPFLKREDWLHFYYPKIRTWLEQQKTVVFTILGTGLYLDSIFAELTARFDDIAQTELKAFEQSPLAVHVKLSPHLGRNNN